MVRLFVTFRYSWAIIPLRFLLLNSLMIPISLKVTLDAVKFIYSRFIEWDLALYDEETDTMTRAKK